MKIFNIILAGALIFFSSCTKDFEDINENTKKPTEVSPDYLISGAQLNMMYNVAIYSVNENVTHIQSQHFAQNSYVRESRNIFRPGLGDSWQYEFYTALNSLNDAEELVKALPVEVANDNEKKSYYLIIETLRSYAWQNLTDWFGPIVFTGAFDIENPTPEYDSQETVYTTIMENLANAIDNSVDTVNSPIGEQDIIYKGNTIKWRKFANSLLLRMAMRVADIDDNLSVTYANRAVNNNGGVFTSNDDNALLPYLAVSPNENPMYSQTFSTRVEITSSNTIIDLQTALNDPRREIYWVVDDGIEWKGLVYGRKDSLGDYNAYPYVNPQLVGAYLKDKANLPGIFIDYAEVEFFLAEAVVRTGYNVTGTAKEHYDNGIRASILFWGQEASIPTDANALATAYIAQPIIDLDQYPSDAEKLARIGEEKWLALFLQEPEAWAEVRRLDAPTLNVPPDMDAEDRPLRYIFSSREYAVNDDNVQAAKAFLTGGDDTYQTPLWWDVN